MIDINDLEVEQDISVSAPEDYAENSAPPLPIGTYTLRVLDFDFEPSKTAGKAPTLILKQIEVADGPFEGRRVTFQRVYATPFDRKDSKTGEMKKVSQLGDLLRALDPTIPTNQLNLPLVKQVLVQAVDERTTFKAKVDREGFDTDFYKGEAERRGIQKGDYKSESAKTLRKQATLRGKNFYATEAVATNPNSGNRVEARNVISNYYTKRLD